LRSRRSWGKLTFRVRREANGHGVSGPLELAARIPHVAEALH